jgi:glycosyltransferase involved in cell wall biosynthesis
MPYAALSWLTKRRPRHVMIGHRLSAPKKLWLHRALRLQRRIDVVVVYASTQRDVALRLGYRPDQVVLSTFMVDTTFWHVDQVERAPRSRPLICAVGQELRDYPTMVEAVRGLDVDVVIAAASPWSKRADTSAGIAIPDNVTVRGYDMFELRQLYADCDLVVVPLQETDFQAGITTILEAMAMERAIVCTRTTGQQDTIDDGVTGRYVPVADAGSLRRAIEGLLADPDEAHRLGVAARRWVIERADIVQYAETLAAVTRGT